MCNLDLHRHGEFSSFDGFGKALDLAKLAKEKGITALGLTDHGTMGGLVEHWKACREVGIKPILGVEGYFQPKFNKENPVRDSFHLCLFAKNLEGYKNLNRIMTIAFTEQRYYKPIIDFPLLEKYSEGLIVTSGCIASFISQTIAKGRLEIAEKALKKFIDLFGDDFYIEIQPYKLDERTPEEENLQEKINVQLIKFAKKYKVKMVLTSDAHYGSENDYDTYCKMHEIKGSGEFNNTYKERYMPNKDDLFERFIDMHEDDFTKDIHKIASKIKKDMQELEDKFEEDILGQLPLVLPKVSNNSKTVLKNSIMKGLKEKGLYNKKGYLERAKTEYDVITHHGFEDYFLIVADYTQYAKDNNIYVGPGRGSVCNSLVAYLLNITTVDPIYFDIDFARFMRKDKKKMPDIDLDFEPDRRNEVIDYILKKYPGQAAQICSYGTYQVDNLLNDLFKVCGVENADEKKEIKTWVRKQIVDDKFKYENVSRTAECKMYNRQYDNIILHFSKMYKKVRFIGTHAAGVAIVGGEILDYTSIEVRGSKQSGYMYTTCYDLNNLEEINAIKFDILGLRTLSIVKELEEMTNECFEYKWLEDEKLYDYFREGKTDGIFQLEKPTAKNILSAIETHNINDIIAASALNRPGPLQLKMPEQYAQHKKDRMFGNEPWAEFTNETYGTIVYQEQVQSIVTQIGLLSWADADKVLKVMKSTYDMERNREEVERIRKDFIAGCKKSRGLNREQALELFNKLIVYSFNKGHSTGYSLVSAQQMYYKVYYPEQFWFVTLKHAKDQDLFRLRSEAVREGNIILIPHVNYGSKYSIVTIEGDHALAEGISNIKGVGPKAADAIEKERKENGKYKNKQDFIDRNSYKGSPVNVGVVRALEEAGALVFDKKTYFERVQKWNSHLYMMGGR